jgi:hypothetical protein
MPAISEVLFSLGLACALVSLGCYLLVVSAMFTNGQRVMGVICSVTPLAYGIGYLVALVYGWMMVGEWKLQTVMLVWTGTAILALICFGVELMLTGR